MPSSVLPEPGIPLASTVLLRMMPPSSISSSPRMPVGTSWTMWCSALRPRTHKELHRASLGRWYQQRSWAGAIRHSWRLLRRVGKTQCFRRLEKPQAGANHFARRGIATRGDFCRNEVTEFDGQGNVQGRPGSHLDQPPLAKVVTQITTVEFPSSVRART